MRFAARNATVLIANVLIAIGITNSAQSSQGNGQRAGAGRAKLQPLKVKPGLWESRTTINRTGELPIPASALERLTPQQRGRLEARMKANSGQSKTTTHKSCLKKEDLDHPNFTDKQQCTWTTLESTGTRFKGTATCDYREMGAKLSGTGEFIAVDEEHIKGTIHLIATGNSRKMVTDGTLTSKWLGSSCGNAK